MFFEDAESCKVWLASLPANNIHKAQQGVLDALRILNRESRYSPLTRLTCVEMLRERVAVLLAEQRLRYVGKTIPLAAGEYGAWTISRQLIDEMEAGYRRCLTEAIPADAPLAAHAALIIQRIIRAIGLQMLAAGFIYRHFDKVLWTRLHTQWRDAEALGLTNTRVKDKVGAVEGYSSITQAYTAVLLGQMAHIHELTPRQIDFVDAVMKRFGHKVTMGVSPSAEGAVCCVDLNAEAGAAFTTSFLEGATMRVLFVDELSKSLRRRAKRLIDGEEPNEMDLPEGWTPTDARNQIVRLHRLWCEGAHPRRAGVASLAAEAVVAFGIAETHFFVAGDGFEQPDISRELTRQEMSEITLFGRVSEATVRARYAEYNYGTETWPIVDESLAAFRLLRPPKSARGVAIGAIVGLRVGKNADFYLGVIRELLDETEGKITVSVTLLPGKPEATAVRAADARHLGTGQYKQGFRLPPNEALKIAETLVLPQGLVARGKRLDIFHPGHGSAKEVTIVDFVERGIDFDRVTIA